MPLLAYPIRGMAFGGKDEVFNLSGLLNSSITDTTNGIKSSLHLTTDKWFSVDKGQHFLGSMIIMIGLTLSMEQRAETARSCSHYYGAGFTISLGLAKEFRDHTRPNNFFSYKDLLADILGICAGGILVSLK